MKGEREFDIGVVAEKIKKEEEKHPEKFLFKKGDSVWARNKTTGDMEEWNFAGWDPNTGEAVVTRGEIDRTHEMRKVSKDDLLEKSR